MSIGRVVPAMAIASGCMSAPQPGAPAPPWPLELPPRRWPHAVRETWLKLQTPLTFHEQHRSLRSTVEAMAEELDIVVVWRDSQADEAGEVHYACTGLRAETCLRLLLQPRSRDFLIAPEGWLVVRRACGIERMYCREARELRRTHRTLEDIHSWLEDGWDGRSSLASKQARRLHERLVSERVDWSCRAGSFYEARTDLLGRLQREHLVRSWGDVDSTGDVLPAMHFGATIHESLTELGRASGVAFWIENDGSLVLATEDFERARRQRQLTLQAALRRAIPTDLPRRLCHAAPILEDLADVRIFVAERAWHGRQLLPPPGGESLDLYLQRLASAGLRAALHDGAIWIVE